MQLPASTLELFGFHAITLSAQEPTTRELVCLYIDALTAMGIHGGAGSILRPSQTAG